MLSVKKLTVELDDKRILNNLELHLEPKESLAILGCSGTGKSVLLKSLLGLLPMVSGEIIINGFDITNAKESEKIKARSSIGMLFQGGALFDSLTIWENVAFGLIYGQKMDKDKAKEIALEKLEMVDLNKSVAMMQPSSLSGGMKKRVGLARALALHPKIIFFDEPTTGLDPITSEIVNELIVKLAKDSDIAAITITHDLNSLRKIADRVAFLFEGKIIWTGSVSEMDNSKNPYIRQFLDACPIGPLTDSKQ